MKIRSMYLLGILLVFIFISPSSSQVLIDNRGEGIGIVINGPIRRETQFEFVRAIADIPQQFWKEIVYVLNSPGGSPDAALYIAEAIRGTSSIVLTLSGSECASACFLLLAAAKTKLLVADAFIGIHSAQTLGAGENWDALAVTAIMAKYASHYGIPDAIIGKLVRTPAAGMAQLTIHEMQSLPGATVQTRSAMLISDLIKNAVPVDSYRAGVTAGQLIASNVKWAGKSCNFSSSQFQRGCTDGYRQLRAGAR